MAIDVGWAHAPDSLQGATGILAAQGGVLYVFAEGELDVPAIEIGTEEFNDVEEIRIVECHVHIRIDQPQRIHVTWKLESPNLRRSDFYQWFTCSPDGSVSYDNNGGMKAILDNNPDYMTDRDKHPRQFLRRGVTLIDGADDINEHTLAYSTMLATELAMTLTAADASGGPRRPRVEEGMALGWGVAPDDVAGATGQLRGSDVVYTYGAPVATAAGYPVASCELWLSPNHDWACSVAYRLTDPDRDVDIVHWFSTDGKGGVARTGESVSADGSEPTDPAKAAEASAALWDSSENIAAAVRIEPPT